MDSTYLILVNPASGQGLGPRVFQESVRPLLEELKNGVPGCKLDYDLLQTSRQNEVSDLFSDTENILN